MSYRFAVDQSIKIYTHFYKIKDRFVLYILSMRCFLNLGQSVPYKNRTISVTWGNIQQQQKVTELSCRLNRQREKDVKMSFI